MTIQLEISEQERDELIQFYTSKRDKALKDLEAANGALAKLYGKRKPNGSVASLFEVPGREPIAWKYKIDEVLKETGELPANKIVQALIDKEPELQNKLESVRKSVASALSSNSKDDNDRYKRRIDKGLSYYSLNAEFKE